MRMIRMSLVLVAMLAGVGRALQPADLILVGARVWTGDGTPTAVRSIAIAGERIIAVVTEAESCDTESRYPPRHPVHFARGPSSLVWPTASASCGGRSA